MTGQQFKNVQPGNSIPEEQHSQLHQTAENQQIYIPPAVQMTATPMPLLPMPLPQTPMPQQDNGTQMYLTSVLALVSVPQPQPVQSPLPETPSPCMHQEPITQYTSAIRRPIQPPSMSFSSKHSYVIPAYKPFQAHRSEPNIAEVLIALAMLVVTHAMRNEPVEELNGKREAKVMQNRRGSPEEPAEAARGRAKQAAERKK